MYDKLNISNVINVIYGCMICLLIIFYNEIKITIKEFIATHNLNSVHINIILILVGIFGIFAYRKYGEIAANKFGLMAYFIAFSILARTKFESFLTMTSSNVPDNPLIHQDIENAKALILQQVERDPNKTPLEKTVIESITNEYFGKSNKLEQLYNFDANADTLNPVIPLTPSN